MHLSIIETQSELEHFYSKWDKDDCIIHAIQSNEIDHSSIAKVSLILIRFLNNQDFIIPINHNEKLSVDIDMERFKVESSNKRYCFDKKMLLHIFKSDLNFKDLNIERFITGNDIIKIEDYNTSTHTFFNSKFFNRNVNEIIPMLKHYEKFSLVCDELIIEIEDEFKFKHWNDLYVNCLYEIESSGLKVNSEYFKILYGEKGQRLIHDDFVYSQYNFYTSTSRPSNRFGGVNYAALNKDNGSRNCFVSRFKKGFLYSIDYSAYHPRLIGKLSDYEIPFDIDAYEYLGKQFNGKDSLTTEEIQASKQLVFKLLYGGIEDVFKEIPYFGKMSDYIDLNWEISNQRGYAETPFFKRKIYIKDIVDVNKSKLANYLIQASETERNVLIMKKVLDYLKDKQTRFILYTYDSFTFDVSPDDSDFILVGLNDIIQDKKTFPTKCYQGVNYSQLERVKL